MIAVPSLRTLGAGDREAITLCHIEGLSQHEFSRRKDLSLPGAKSRVQRARERLHDQISTACQVRFDRAGYMSDFVPRPSLT